MADILVAARDHWHRSADLNAVRAEVASLVAGAGGVATAEELAAGLPPARGSVEENAGERARSARAILRAAVELEAAVNPARFSAYAEAQPVLVAGAPELAEYARRLDRAADKLARETPLPSPPRVEDELGLVPVPDGAGALPSGRTLRPVAAASAGAALSARLELYPRGLLALGALSGPEGLTAAEAQARVRGRFPEAEPLPDRPALDLLLAEAGADRDWRIPPGKDPGYYGCAADGTASASLTAFRHATTAPLAEATPQVLAARMLEERVAYATRTGGFLALTVEPARAADADAEAELMRRFRARSSALST